MKKYAKAVAAAVGSAAALGITIYDPSSTAGKVCAAIVAVATVFGVYKVRNTPSA